MPSIRHLPPRYDLFWDASTRDVVMDRIPVLDPDACAIVAVRRRWNLPQELWPIDGLEMGWGLEWERGQVAAMNVLDRYLGLPPSETMSYYGRTIPCASVVLDLAYPFYADLLRPIGYWGGVIEGAKILQWIAEHRTALDQWGIDLADPGDDASTLIV